MKALGLEMEKKWACACLWLGLVSLSTHHQPGPSVLGGWAPGLPILTYPVIWHF